MKERYGVSLTGEVYADLCHTEPVWDRNTYCGRRRGRGRVGCERWPSCGCETPQKDFPGAELISRHHICLPLYPGLTEAELSHVVDSLKATLAGLGGK
jgi:dTDP-4-amino-4,6-dideoxygalactose transaminase